MATGRIPTTANSPLTAKGDIFTFSTGSAKLAVGNDGDTLVADSSTATGLAYREDYAAGKNKIINGDFRFNQRAFTSTTTDGTYGFDRWVLASAGGCTYSAQTFTPGTAPVAGYEAINYARLLTTGQSGAGAYSFLIQAIEDVRTLAGQTATISFWAKAASGTPKIAVEINQVFGSGGSPSATVSTYVNQVTLSTSWARYSVTIAVPSISGKTIGTTANTSYLGLDLWVSAGTNFNSRTGSLGIQSNTFDIWGVQVEESSVATAFQTATGTIQGELAACQRYYWRATAGSVYAAFSMGYVRNASVAFGTIQFPVVMRVAPTSLDFSTISFLNYAGTFYAMSSVSIDLNQNSTLSANINGTVSGATAGHVGNIAANGSTSAYIGFSAEL
jgi:hypothetical protein